MLCDRGLYSRTIYRAMVDQGWHPLMRENSGGTIHPTGSDGRQRITAFVPRLGTSVRAAPASPSLDAASRGSCTLLACWEVGCERPLVYPDGPGPPAVLRGLVWSAHLD